MSEPLTFISNPRHIEVYEMYVSNPLVQENSFLNVEREDKELPVFDQVKTILPQPFWNGQDEAIQCYWKAWELAFGNLRKPTPENGFVSNFIDTAFNDCLFMWDSSFILLFARYGSRAFNFQRTLDNLYAKQHKDGFICREIDERAGLDRYHRFDPSSTGPNILPMAEWEYYLNFGDKERLSKVFPILVAYHRWLREYRTWPDGTYWSSGWGCGMDNQPRLERIYDERWSHGHMVWTDTCFQQILSAKLLLQMSWEVGRTEEIPDFEDEINSLSSYMNRHLWDENTAFYYDRWKDGRLNYVKSIGAYWSLLADVVPSNSMERFIGHLTNEKEFNRPHPIPTLSADDPGYHEGGDYWRGGVWAPTNYMVLKGLQKSDYNALAHNIAVRHLEHVVKVFLESGTLWENYAPELVSRGFHSKGDFVGWTGLSPIAVLFEFVFGLKPDVPNAKLVWDVRLLQAHGVSQYPFGIDGIMELRCEERECLNQKPVITASSTIPLTLVVKWENGEEYVELGK
ncbi:MGH1-like glycoside hydrolase domain-containing protein [Paenibacillus roseipurpureus]|uniref:Trehalase family glycosidase n=1 Tax=Paenibacillus roseopurpureus TaxID=2918901 RepID=A0AA96LRK3_9BACL|nr:trehalase family glycosidase [Paenibacillus sp. MBLB1832]WNR45972.1 trehalase family glycosidase [Paenibacillus sp. MBLB1832]